MRTTSLVKVTDAIGTGRRTIPEIIAKTGLAYNTVKAALPILGAERVADSSPAVFELPKKDTSKAPRAKQGVVEIEVTEHDDWPSRWNNAREVFAQQIRTIEIDPLKDPAKIADDFMRAARSLASAGHAIRQHLDAPDWYVLIGGDLESDPDTK